VRGHNGSGRTGEAQEKAYQPIVATRVNHDDKRDEPPRTQFRTPRPTFVFFWKSPKYLGHTLFLPGVGLGGNHQGYLSPSLMARRLLQK
jgi:hypothetical protein